MAGKRREWSTERKEEGVGARAKNAAMHRFLTAWEEHLEPTKVKGGEKERRREGEKERRREGRMAERR